MTRHSIKVKDSKRIVARPYFIASFGSRPGPFQVGLRLPVSRVNRLVEQRLRYLQFPALRKLPKPEQLFSIIAV